VFSVR